MKCDNYLCQGKMTQPRMLTDMPICVLACTIILFVLPLQSCANGGKESLEVRVDHQSSGSGIGGRVCSVGWLCLLLFLLPLFAQATFRWLVHAPCHMMLAPMVSVLARLLAPEIEKVKLTS
jgi:hypothetical protein